MPPSGGSTLMVNRSRSTGRSPGHPVRALPSAPSRPVIAVAAPFRHPLAPTVPTAGPVLLPVLGVDDEILPAFERAVQPVAECAHLGDHAARDALYAAFEPKLMRFVRRIRVPYAPGDARGLWDRDDVAQEAYLVFLGVIESWSPAIPFGRYVLANFPWRLRDAVHRGIARRGVPPRTVAVPIDRAGWLADRAAEGAETRALIETLAASFEPPLDAVLRLHILDGLSLTDTAERLGVSRRSATRYWGAILTRLREPGSASGTPTS
jgi:RNA polymerase sigma factor (sigma-70 family)